ncbi:MAG: HD domain-containing protein [Chitinophagaceae bacterium]|nr:HD domain-containing protein [Chitinophagaceae bacterium]
MNYAQLLDEVKQEVTHFFQLHENAGFAYHNLSHTERVVTNAGLLARHYQLDDKDFFIVTTAAWFHDTGYYVNGAADHELRGTEIAAAFLQGKGVDEVIIHAVSNCIMATCLPQSPKNLLEQIVCDADLFHLGTGEFPDQNKKMRKEAEWRTNRKISKHEWRQSTIRLFESHHFQTDYGQSLLTEKKKENLQRLKNKESGEIEETVTSTTTAPAVPKAVNIPKPQGEPKKVKVERPERGIETMFRISSQNHQRLSDMADNKANIMITTTSIILSVLLSVLLRKLEDNQNLIIPTILLLIVCVVTMVCSILATRPAIPPGIFTQKEIDDKKVNLLFFGNFYRMSYDEYNKGMQEMMNDREFLYGSLTRDVYSQGVVLGRKYRLLRAGYNVFMFGIVISVLAFMIAAIFF